MAVPTNPILISALTNEAITVEDADTMLIDQGGIHKRITGANFKASLLDTWQISGSDVYYNNGFVGIGTINAEFLRAPLHIKSDTNNLWIQKATGTTNNSFDAVTVQNGDNPNHIAKMTAKVDSFADRIGFEFITVNGTPVTALSIGYTGTLTSAGIMTATNFQLSSDERDKNILEEIGGEKVKFIRFNTDKDKRDRYGVSAQELQKTMPDLVEKTADGRLVVKYIDLLVSEVARLSNKLENVST